MRRQLPAAEDEKFMRLALQKARQGARQTHPNPAVGAVIVRAGRILATGWHRGAGLPHAEIEALRALEGSPRGATIYITLEPCSTHGRTPPCTDAIRSAGLARVVYGATDPNPNHAGRARKLLSRAGIVVESGVLEQECAALNRHWNKWIATGLPYVIAKAALTLDGRISSHPESRWISNEASRADAMTLRRSVQAILVGGQTVRIDNPRLTMRGAAALAGQPWRVVWSRSGRIPAGSHLLTDEHRERTLLLKHDSLQKVLADLGRRQIASVLIEGGSQVLGRAFRDGLVDEVYCYLAPLLTGGPTRMLDQLPGLPAMLHDPTYRKIGNDMRVSGLLSARA